MKNTILKNISKNKILLTTILFLIGLFSLYILASRANDYNITLVPDLDITRFAPYKITANINDAKSVNLRISGLNGNIEETDCWDYYVDGSCASEEIEKNMFFNLETNLWESENIFPDDIYPEIFFIPSNISWNNPPEELPFNRNNYQLLKFNNPFEMVDGMSFFIEFNAKSKASNSADLDVYLVSKDKEISFFHEDWRSSDDVVQVATIDRNDEFHHNHGDNSAHHLVALSTDNDGKVAGLDISDNFWIILYNRSPNNNRGWDLRYHQTGCEIEGYWYQGSQSNWSTNIQAGCPDVHVHVSRALTGNNTEVNDGVKAEIIITFNNDSTATSSTEFYFQPLVNLAPNPTSFISPEIGGVYKDDGINISWNEAIDPNNDPITYNLYYKKDNDTEFTEIVTGLTDTTYYWDISEIENADYTLKGSSCDQDLCTDFLLNGDFEINKGSDIYSLSSISLSSNNFYPTIARNSNIVSLSFEASGSLDNIEVDFFSGGESVSGPITITNPDTNEYLTTYTVNTADIAGFVSFIISADNLDLDYTETTDDSLVEVVSFSQGLGTTANPYLIETWKDLDNVRYFLNSHFKLNEDLSKDSLDFNEIVFYKKNFKGDWEVASYNLNDLVYHDSFYWFANKTTSDEPSDLSDDWEKHSGFTPIGGNSNRFTGSFDGSNKTISDLYIYQPDTDHIGLFGVNEGTQSEIYDLSLENVNVTGRNLTGGLIGKANSNSKIINVNVSGKVSGVGQVGGIVGYLRNALYLEKGKSTANVTGTGNRVGGISGNVWNSNVRESGSSGTVTGTNEVGGLVGRVNSNSLISKSFSSGEVYGNQNVGGLLGEVSTNSIIEYSYSLSDVYGNENVGGLIGDLYSASESNYCIVKDSYSFGDVNRISGSNTSLGGFIGASQSGKKFNNYSTGRVLWQTEPHPTDKGFLGSLNTGFDYEMSGNFWDIDTSFQTSSLGDALGKTTSEMKDITTFTSASWDIVLEENYDDEIWKIKDSVDYPRLGLIYPGKTEPVGIWES